MARSGLILLALLLAGCSGADTDASGASPSEARQLNEAAESLDQNAATADATTSNANDEDPSR